MNLTQVEEADPVKNFGMGTLEKQEVAGGWATLYTAPCPGKERPNEDKAALIPMDPIPV